MDSYLSPLNHLFTHLNKKGCNGCAEFGHDQIAEANGNAVTEGEVFVMANGNMAESNSLTGVTRQAPKAGNLVMTKFCERFSTVPIYLVMTKSARV